MHIEQHRRQSVEINLSSDEGREQYDELLNNPACRILNKRHVTQTYEESFGPGMSSSRDEQYLFLEVEWCHL